VESFSKRISTLSPNRLALLAIELQERVEALEGAAHEPIAVIGMACRMPGGGDTPEAFWEVLRQGRDTVGHVPEERLSLSSPQDEISPEMRAQFGAFLKSVEMFDARFFQISPTEAISMDPQQRLLLEVCWEALENSGIAAEALSGTDTGVFMGISATDYSTLAHSIPSSRLNKYVVTGASNSIAVGRISYLLGLQGPNMAVDTSCSASATAVHLACQSLRRHECGLALAGGVNLTLLPQITETLSQFNMLAANGRCKTFSAAADGFGRGEGCGVIVLKRLSEAERGGDNILGVIRGSACNQDGRSSGLTAPNGMAQEKVIASALKDAGVAPSEVDYIEAHGTGTPLGDPIEVSALGRVFGQDRSQERPLRVGSVKTNIGHLEAAAGISGILKVLLALEYERVPPHLHGLPRNPRIPWEELPFAAPAEGAEWKRGARRRVAGISSFGYSGTNIHLVLEEARKLAPPRDEQDAGAYIVTASAKSREALKELAERYSDYLSSHPQTSMASFARSVNAGRSHFSHRLAAVVKSADEAQRAYASFAEGAPTKAVSYRFVSEYRAPEITFWFPGRLRGQATAARRLFDTSAIFREAFTRCGKALSGERELLGALSDGENASGPASGSAPGSPFDAGQQAAWFAFAYALSEVWRSWGVRPSAVAGEGVGELAAACVAGVFSPEEGVSLAASLGEAMAADKSAQPTATGLAAFDRAASTIVYARPALRFLTGLSGGEAGATPDADYWRRRVRSRDAWRPHEEIFKQSGSTMVLEIGPEPPEADTAAAGNPAHWLATLPQAGDAWAQMLRSVASVYLAGAAIDWSAVPIHSQGTKLVLPNYPFQRQRYWFDIPEHGTGHAMATARKPLAAHGPEGTGESDTESDTWLYEIAWKQIAVEKRAAESEGETVVSRIMTSMTPVLEEAAARGNYEYVPQFRSDADALSLQFILNALEQNGWKMTPKSRIPVDACLALGISRKYERLMDRILGILKDEGVIAQQGSEWVVRREVRRVDAQQEIGRLKRVYPQAAPELNVVERAAHLGSILGGKRSSLEILFPNGSLALAEGLYKDSVTARLTNSLAAEVARKVLRYRPAGRKLKILEIGAGTGGTTASILPLLPADRVEYVFTDISKHFLATAAQKFAAFPFVRYQTHDIDQAGVPAGHEPHSFDLVIAANVLHATKSLRQTIARVRDLMAPRSFLLLLEAARSERLADITLGTIEGWWKFEDLDVRKSSVLIGPDQWQKLLSESGFSSALLPPEPAFGGIIAQQPVILAQLNGEEIAASAERADGAVPEQRRALVISTGDSFAERMTASLRRQGMAVTHAASAQGYRRISADAVEFSPAEPGGYAQLLKQGEGHKQDKSFTDVIDARPASFATTGPSPAVARHAQQTAAEALQLVRALVAAPGAPPSLCFVTRGMQSAAGPAVNMASSVLTGLVRVLAAEHPQLRCRAIDGEAEPDDAGVDRLAEVILNVETGGEVEVAVRGDRILAPRLQPAPVERGRGLQLDPEGSYLVTGAFGVLGSLTSRWIADNGAGTLFLMGRNEPSAAGMQAIDEIRRAGTAVEVVVGDVSLEVEVERLFERIRGSAIPLRGIFHAAGVLEDSAVDRVTPEAMSRVFAPKVQGSWLLHQHSQGWSLDHFVLFSSAAAVLAAPGQASYAMANTFLDGLAHYRRGLRLPAVSIDWGPWAASGAALKRDYLEDWEAIGGVAIEPAQGLEILSDIMQSQNPQIAVLPIPSYALSSGSRQIPALLRDRVSNRQRLPTVEPDRPSELKTELEEAPPEERTGILKAYVETRLAELLGLEKGVAVPSNLPLLQLGLDSLMALELKNEIQTALDITLPPTIFFDYPTVDGITEYFGLILKAEQLRDQKVSPDADYDEIRI
jgi:acyl transferase domain-containing protein/acyl carrier protein